MPKPMWDRIMGFLHHWTVHKPHLVSINLTGPSSGVASHDVGPYTAQGVDQYGNPFPITATLVSSIPAKATVNSSTRIATCVVPGVTNITATFGGIISNAIALTVAAQVPTAVTINPPTFDITSIGGSKALAAAVTDQLGGVIVSPTVLWSVDTPATATVDSVGIVTAHAPGSVIVTAACDAASGTSAGTVNAAASTFDPSNSSTGAGILQSNGARPYWFDYARRYTGIGYASPDDQFRKTAISHNISVYSDATLAPTANLGAWVPYANTGNRYGDGRYADLVRLVPTPDPAFGPTFNEPCFESTLPGANIANGTPTGELRPASNNTAYNIILARRKAYCSTPMFTAIGDADDTNGGATYNLTQGAGWKSGPFAEYLGSGRGGQECANWNGAPINGGEIFLLNNPPSSGGFSETTFVGDKTDSAWHDGAFLWEAIVLEQWKRLSDNTFWVAATRFTRRDADTHWTQASPRIVKAVTSITPFFEFDVIPGNKNYNRSRKTPLKTWTTHGAIWDIDNPNNDGANDPLSFFSYIASIAPVTPASITILSATSTAVTVKVPMSKYAGRIRIKIDGTFYASQDYIVQREDAEQLVVGLANTVDYKQFTISGLSLTPGTHTIAAYAVNKNNTLLDPTGVSTNFTV